MRTRLELNIPCVGADKIFYATLKALIMITVNDLIDALQKLPADLKECAVVTENDNGGYDDLKAPAGSVNIYLNAADKYSGQWKEWAPNNFENMQLADCLKAIVL